MRNPFVFHDVRTREPAASTAFYRDMFGWEAAEIEAGPMKLSFLTGPNGNWAGFTALPEGDERVPMWIPYVPVPDVDEARTRAEKLGATVVRERTEVPQGSLVVIAEPGGAPLTLWQERAA